MGYVERVSAIAGLVAALPDAGVVHSRVRWAAQWGDYIALFRAPDGRINGWEITRGRAEPAHPRWQEVYRLRRFYGLRDADATDHAFQDSLDSAARLFVEGRDLSFGTVANGLAIRSVEERMFGSMLCHYAECEVTASLYAGDL